MNKKNQINIFIVEDNKIFTQALKADIESTFERRSINVHSFETGETCMEKFNDVNPQVVILDYSLNSVYPNAADGIKVLDWIKIKNFETNVIILTSNDNIEIALNSFRHGASDYVVKSETLFRKINYSLYNIFKIMEAKNDAKLYKKLTFGISLCVALVIIGVIAIQIFDPSFLR